MLDDIILLVSEAASDIEGDVWVLGTWRRHAL